MNIEFKKGRWEDVFQYVYNERFPFKPGFIQEEDCISNGRNPKMPDGFDYTTIMTKEKYPIGTTLWLTCSFEAYGAPLIMLTDSLNRDEDGDLWYGVGQEFVLWENGFNAFDFFKEKGTLKWNKLLSDKFSLQPDKRHEICLEIMEKYIRFTIEEKSVLLRVESLANEFYIGITGCENINRLYSIKIEKTQSK